MKEIKTYKLLPAILAMGAMSFSGVLIETAMNVTFPTLIKEFGVTTGQVQWVTTIYLLMISIIVPLLPYLLKQLSVRTLFVLSNLMFLAGLVTDFFAVNFVILLLGRLLQGVGTGIALPLMFHVILSQSPVEKRGTMIGIGTLTTAIAPAIGPTYGGYLTASLSWNHIFLFLIPVLILSLGLGLYAIPNETAEKSGVLDGLSLLGLVLFFSGSLYFLSEPGSRMGLISLIISVLGLVLFIFRSKKVAMPLIRLSVLRQGDFRLCLVSFLVCQLLLLGLSFVVPTFMQTVQNESALVAGLTLCPGAITSAVLLPFSGRILDHVGPRKPIIIGLVVASVGWLGLILVLDNPSIIGFIIAHVIYMIGSGLCYSNLMTTGMNALKAGDHPDGNALFNTLQQYAGALATALVASILNITQQHLPGDFKTVTTIGSQLGLGVLLILLLLVLYSCIRRLPA